MTYKQARSSTAEKKKQTNKRRVKIAYVEVLPATFFRNETHTHKILHENKNRGD